MHYSKGAPDASSALVSLAMMRYAALEGVLIVDQSRQFLSIYQETEVGWDLYRESGVLSTMGYCAAIGMRKVGLGRGQRVPT
jgi:hypothetical protein